MSNSFYTTTMTTGKSRKEQSSSSNLEILMNSAAQKTELDEEDSDQEEELEIDQGEDENELPARTTVSTKKSNINNLHEEGATTLINFALALCNGEVFQNKEDLEVEEQEDEKNQSESASLDDTSQALPPANNIKQSKRKTGSKKKEKSIVSREQKPSTTGRKRGRPPTNASTSGTKASKKGKSEESSKSKKNAETGNISTLINIPFNKRTLDNEFLERKSLESPPHPLSIFDNMFLKTMEEFKRKYDGTIIYKIPPPLPHHLMNRDKRQPRIAENMSSNQSGSFFSEAKSLYNETDTKVYNRNAFHVAIAHFIFRQEENKKCNVKYPTMVPINVHAGNRGKENLIATSQSISNTPVISSIRQQHPPVLASALNTRSDAVELSSGNPISMNYHFPSGVVQSSPTMGALSPSILSPPHPHHLPFTSGNIVRANPFNPAAAAAFTNPISTQQLMLQQTNYGFGFSPNAFNPQAMAAAASYATVKQLHQQPYRKDQNTPTKK